MGVFSWTVHVHKQLVWDEMEFELCNKRLLDPFKHKVDENFIWNFKSFLMYYFIKQNPNANDWVSACT
jgi:hypothetical protein